MRIKDVAAMVKACKRMVLVNTRVDGKIVRQHLLLGGMAMYPLDGMQAITPETLLTIADVEECEREKYQVDQVDMNPHFFAMAEDDVEGERHAVQLKTILKLPWVELTAVTEEGGGETLFFPVKMLKPVKDMEQLELFTREIGGGKTIIVKSGMMAVAAIAPSTSWAGADQVADLASMFRAAVVLAEENALKEAQAK